MNKNRWSQKPAIEQPRTKTLKGTRNQSDNTNKMGEVPARTFEKGEKADDKREAGKKTGNM